MAEVSKLVDELLGLTRFEAAELAKLLKERWRPPKVPRADIKRDLPAFPDGVVNQWLFHLAQQNDTGWPPPDPLGLHRWAFILGHRPLPWWREVTWKLEKTDCSFAGLAPFTKTIVIRMLREKTDGTIDKDTGRRFDRAVKYILSKAEFEEPPVAMRLADGLSILDGNHRVTAFCWLQMMTAEQFEKLGSRKPALKQNVWIGTDSRGETPLDYPPDIELLVIWTEIKPVLEAHLRTDSRDDRALHREIAGRTLAQSYICSLAINLFREPLFRLS